MTDDKKKPMSKVQFRTKLAEDCGLTTKQVEQILDAQSAIIIQQVNSIGSFTLPGLLKITRKTKPATPEKQGINPFTKEPMTIKAKPARSVVKVNVLKPLKDAVV